MYSFSVQNVGRKWYLSSGVCASVRVCEPFHGFGEHENIYGQEIEHQVHKIWPTPISLFSIEYNGKFEMKKKILSDDHTGCDDHRMTIIKYEPNVLHPCIGTAMIIPVRSFP